MANPFEGKTVVLTGSSGGIGRATATALLARGATVHGLDSTSPTVSHERFHAYEMDVSQAAHWQQVTDSILAQSPAVDFLINNAGISLLGETHELTFAQWRKVLDVNFLGTMLGTRAFYPHMVERRSGHIVNVSSVAGVAGYAAAQAYAASKGAILGFSRSLRHEARRYGIKVTTVCPGYVDTAIYDGEATPGVDTAQLKSRFPVGLIPVEKAAEDLLHGIARGRRNVVFPLTGRLLNATALWLPPALVPIHRKLIGSLQASRDNH